MEECETRMTREERKRFVKITKSLEISRIPYFVTIVTKSQMEIPAGFVRDHGSEMKPMTSVRLESGSKVWPMTIQITYHVRFRVRFCTRWRIFVSENGLKIGDEVIVALVAMSEFVVYMFKNSKNPEKLSRYSSQTTSFNTPSASSWDVLPITDECTPKRRLKKCRTVPLNLSRSQVPKPAVKSEMPWPEISKNRFGAIQFRKKLTEISTGYYGFPQNSKLEIPAEFVRLHKRLLSNNLVITLEGPTSGHSYEVVCYWVKCYADSHRIWWKVGWHNFVNRNKLQKGDELHFTLTAPNRFAVQLTQDRWRKVDCTMLSKDVNVFGEKSDSPVRGNRIFNKMPLKTANAATRRAHRKDAAYDLLEWHQFSKTLPATSTSECDPYPFLNCQTPPVTKSLVERIRYNAELRRPGGVTL